MSECMERFYRGFKVSVKISDLTLEEVAEIKKFVDGLKAKREVNK